MGVDKGPNLCPTADLPERMMWRAIPGLAKQDGGDGMLTQQITGIEEVLHEISDSACIEHIGLSFKGARGNYFNVGRPNRKHSVHPFPDS
jgi:hypothetical protein